MTDRAVLVIAMHHQFYSFLRLVGHLISLSICLSLSVCLLFGFSQFAAAVIRHMHRMAGHWEISKLRGRAVIRQKPRGQKRVERVFVTVPGISARMSSGI